MAQHSPCYPVVHLSFKMRQFPYYRQLQPCRKRRILDKTKTFSRALKGLGVPTIYVVYGENIKKPGFLSDVVSPSLFSSANDEILKSLSVATYYLAQNDCLYLGSDRDVFSGASPFDPSPLKFRLDDLGSKLILMSGMATSKELIDNAWAAVNHDYNIGVVYDLAGDPCYYPYEMQPEWHKNYIAESLGRFAEGSLFTRREIISFLIKAKPYRPSHPTMRIIRNANKTRCRP